MSDVVAQIQVLSQQTGCVLDLTTILNAAICPKVDIQMNHGNKVDNLGDTICVTPTPQHYKRQEAYSVPAQVCQENTVGLDLYLAVLLGLITDEELDAYLIALGMEPAGFGSGGPGSGGPGGPPSGGPGGPPSGGPGGPPAGGPGGPPAGGPPAGGPPAGGSGGPPSSVNVNPLLSLTLPGQGELANLNVGGQNGLNLDVGKNGNLLTLDLDGKPLINLRRRQNLANVEVGGPTQTNGDINVNLLTHGTGSTGGYGSGSGSNNYGGGSGSGYNSGTGSGYMSYFQPICKKGFSQQHMEGSHSCASIDVNHCLAQCHATAALATIEANAQVGSDEVLVCAAIEFDESSSGSNCYYFVAPESEPCQESELEPSENCYTFFRN